MDEQPIVPAAVAAPAADQASLLLRTRSLWRDNHARVRARARGRQVVTERARLAVLEEEARASPDALRWLSVRVLRVARGCAAVVSAPPQAHEHAGPSGGADRFVSAGDLLDFVRSMRGPLSEAQVEALFAGADTSAGEIHRSALARLQARGCAHMHPFACRYFCLRILRQAATGLDAASPLAGDQVPLVSGEVRGQPIGESGSVCV